MSKDKNTPDIDNLINDLCDGLAPTQKIWCPYKHFVLWISVSIVYFSIVIFVVGLRHDLAYQAHNTIFLFEAALGILFSTTAAICASLLSVPDMRGKEWFRAVPTTLFSVFLLWNIIKGYTEGVEMPHLHWVDCMNNGLFMEAFPLVFIILLSLRGKTTHPIWMTFMNILSVAGIAWLGLRLTCSMDDMGHAFMYHFLPVSVVGALLILFARRIFKW